MPWHKKLQVHSEWNMNRKLPIIILVAGILVAARIVDPDSIQLVYPKDWPEPTYDFDKSPLTAEGIALGRSLFYDPILSADSTISCSSCHLVYTAFTHVDHDLSHGIHDSIGTRNSPTLMNLAWSRHFMWDGSVNHLDMQALAPISHPAEMGEEIAHVVSKLQRSPRYSSIFNVAFGSSQVTGERLLKGLSQFELTLISSNSRYDQLKRGEVEFNEMEQKGYELFRQKCNACHTEPLFTHGGFENNGLPVDTTLNDHGRMLITQDPSDSLLFKVPTLRNIEFSYPYMHDGRFRTIRSVLDHYDNGIIHSETLSAELKNGISLSSSEKAELTAFLLTLSDKTFLFNPDFAFPRK